MLKTGIYYRITPDLDQSRILYCRIGLSLAPIVRILYVKVGGKGSQTNRVGLVRKFLCNIATYYR